MPYADPEKAKAAKRASYNKRYATDAEFRAREIERTMARYEADPQAFHAPLRRRRVMRKLGMV